MSHIRRYGRTRTEVAGALGPISISEHFGVVPVHQRCERQLAYPRPLQHGRLFRATRQCSLDQEGGQAENGWCLIRGPSRVWSSAVFSSPVPIATLRRAL